MTELGEKGPAVSRQLRAQGETDAADRLDEIVVHLNGIGGGRIFVKDLVDFTYSTEH